MFDKIVHQIDFPITNGKLQISRRIVYDKSVRNYWEEYSIKFFNH
jgi:hypothetical protein